MGIRHLHEVYQQMEAWSAALTLNLRKHSEQPPPTPADDIVPQLITDCGNLPLDLRHLGFGSSPLVLRNPRPFISKWDTKFTFHLTRGLPFCNYLTHFWCCLLFRSGTAIRLLSLEDTSAWWLSMNWITVSPLIVTLSQVLELTFVTAVTPLVCARFPTTFNFPLLCFDAALAEQSTFSAMTFCDLTSLWRVLAIRTTPTWVRLHVLK